jgi:hypothetical protein
MKSTSRYFHYTDTLGCTVSKTLGEIRYGELVNHRLLYGRGIIDCECTNICWSYIAYCQLMPSNLPGVTVFKTLS